MRTTRTQPPNMRGKKTYLFRCRCCEARNVLDEERHKMAMREARSQIAEYEFETNDAAVEYADGMTRLWLWLAGADGERA